MSPRFRSGRVPAERSGSWPSTLPIPFLADVTRGVVDAVDKIESVVLLGNSAGEQSRERRYLELFEEQRVRRAHRPAERERPPAERAHPCVRQWSSRRTTGSRSAGSRDLRHRVCVHGDMAIVGYDGSEFAAAAAVPLSSVRQPRGELGRRGAKNLFNCARPAAFSARAKSSTSSIFAAPTVHMGRIGVVARIARRMSRSGRLRARDPTAEETLTQRSQSARRRSRSGLDGAHSGEPLVYFAAVLLPRRQKGPLPGLGEGL